VERGRRKWVRHNLSNAIVYGGLFHGAARLPMPVLLAINAIGNSIAVATLRSTVSDIAEVAGAALSAGAEGVTLVNTVLAMAIDVEARRPVLGSGPGGGGLSGPAIRPVAVRAVYDVRTAHPEAAIIGVGGVMTGQDAVELLMAGADAVQVGTATFRDPKAPITVLRELEMWCSRRGIRSTRELRGAGRG